MKTSVKCSNCGAELETFHFSAGKMQWVAFLLMVVVFVLVLWPNWRPQKPAAGDYRADLTTTVLEKRMTDRGAEVLGTIENRGKVRWEHIWLSVQFYGPDGRFLDEASNPIASSVDPGQKEHFKVTIQQVSPGVDANGVKTEVKVADASALRL
jgi:hypothetical protein